MNDGLRYTTLDELFVCFRQTYLGPQVFRDYPRVDWDKIYIYQILRSISGIEKLRDGPEYMRAKLQGLPRKTA